MPPRRTSRSRSSSGRRNIDDDSNDEEPRVKGRSEDDDDGMMMFSQQAPEMSQAIPASRQFERSNLSSMGGINRQKAITDLSRLILFKALAGEPIDRLKCANEALSDVNDTKKITNAVFDEASSNLRNVFGFELRRVPKFMDKRKSFPAKYKDRMFVINTVEDDQQGSHSKAIHSVHAQSAAEKGLLMVILAYAFCKGESRPDKSRWISDIDLYRLLHNLDENIPEEPPSVANRRVVSATQARYRNGGEGGVAQTPDIDGLFEKFVNMDYLMREKCTDATGPAATQEQDTYQYTMGPRAAMEVGRRQIIYFCSEALDEEEPDPTMIKEIEDEDAEEEEDNAM